MIRTLRCGCALVLAVAMGVSVSAQQSSTGGRSSVGGSSEGAPTGFHDVELSDSAAFDDVASLHRQIPEPLVASFGLSAVGALLHVAQSRATDITRVTDIGALQLIAVYRPTTFEDDGVDQDGNPSPCSNQTNAYDGDITTLTNCFAISNPAGTVSNDKKVIYSGFSALRGGPSSVTLNVNSSGQKTTTCTAFSLGMTYTTDNGAHWTAVPGQTGVYGQFTATVPLSATTDLTKLKVEGESFCTHVTSGSGSTTLKMYEIWVTSQ